MEFCWLEQWPLAVASAGRPRAQGLTEGPATDSGPPGWSRPFKHSQSGSLDTKVEKVQP